MDKQFSPRKLDVKSFAEAGAVIDGAAPIGEFKRLEAETAGASQQAQVEWTATGEVRNPLHVHPDIWLHLRAGATLPLTCQRCLQPVDVDVEVERSFRFVADEETAQAQDDEAEEDLLALSRAFDLHELIEDEMLLEMPIAPRHDVCPEPVVLSVEDPGFEAANEERENPFAVLGKLKPGKKES
ncbi:DUF177 domain-containing protein [Caenimonas koreensis]|uniref:Large ribosomal RNA subunit accumulation protein YceD n=1 Tax=Caenimonas koreensis DSM 17982 TaxID=1121255 RepID=A0A844AZ45_9BURK|nr:DUF177 domain-containing protein [Caenimonas koreensis]MRD47688.1 DUF177 domain-containing protein [Caenimonas koreensis DSM 17982]